MDDDFEAGLLHEVDVALSSPRCGETFKRFEKTFQDFHSDGFENATAHVKHLLFSPGRDLLDFPPEYVAALYALLPRERDSLFVEIIDQLAWTICDDDLELTEEDRRLGYRSLAEFWEFLKDWRSRYRSAFGR